MVRKSTALLLLGLCIGCPGDDQAAQQAAAALGGNYLVVGLGKGGRGFGINSCNAAVGSATHGTPNITGYYFNPQTMTQVDLGTLGGGRSVANAVNSSGVVVGAADTSDVGLQAFVWSDANRNDVSDPGEMQELPPLGPRDPSFQGGIAADINDSGFIVGSSHDSVGFIHATGWSNGVPFDLGTFGGQTSAANGVNNFGDVVGKADVTGSDSHAFLWKPSLGAMIDLGTLGGDKSIAWAINDQGVVVGQAETPDGHWHAFRWEDKNHNCVSDPGEMEDLGVMGGEDSFALDINEAGDIVGYFDPGQATGIIAKAFLYRNGTMHDLNSAIPATAQVLAIRAVAINDRGQIVGEGEDPDGKLSFMLVSGGGPLNRCPTITQIGNQFRADENANVVFVRATDADGDPLSYFFSVEGDAVDCVRIEPGPFGFNSATFVHDGCVEADEDDTTVTVTVKDIRGASTSFKVPLRKEQTINNP